MTRMTSRTVLTALAWIVIVLGLAACSGRGPSSSNSVSSASGFSLFLSVTPNSVPTVQPGNEADKGGCATLTAKLFDSQGRLVDGGLVLFNTTLGVFPKQQGEDEDAVARSQFTALGIATEVICATTVKGTAIVSSTVEDAHTSVLLTMF